MCTLKLLRSNATECGYEGSNVMNATITCKDLKERMAAGAMVVDVMTPEDYAACHLAGAKNACIYEMVFLERIAECVPGPRTELVVYDATGSGQAAKLARERLIQAGFLNVSVLEGGLRAWRSEGLPVEMGDRAAETGSVLRDGNYRIDVEKSALEWIGRNLNNRHHGRITVKSGEIVIKAGMPSAGEVVLDMTGIENLDLQDQNWHDLLLRHLKSEDFFAVDRFPTASFRLNEWQAQEGVSPETQNARVQGELTIKDIARPISFPAVIAPQADGSLRAHALFDIDRTLWDVRYGSGKFYERLGMHLVHDIITLELFVLAWYCEP